MFIRKKVTVKIYLNESFLFKTVFHLMFYSKQLMTEDAAKKEIYK